MVHSHLLLSTPEKCSHWQKGQGLPGRTAIGYHCRMLFGTRLKFTVNITPGEKVSRICTNPFPLKVASLVTEAGQSVIPWLSIGADRSSGLVLIENAVKQAITLG